MVFVGLGPLGPRLGVGASDKILAKISDLEILKRSIKYEKVAFPRFSSNKSYLNTWGHLLYALRALKRRKNYSID